MELTHLRNIVLGDVTISGNERHIFGKGSCNQKAVKGVSVNKGQFFKNSKVGSLNRYNFNVIVFCCLNKTCGIARKTQLTYTDLMVNSHAEATLK